MNALFPIKEVSSCLANVSLGNRRETRLKAAAKPSCKIMDGGNVVKTAFADTPQSVLDERHVAYVADISGMPALVSRR